MTLTIEMLREHMRRLKEEGRQVCGIHAPHIFHPRCLTEDGIYSCGNCGMPVRIENGRET